MTRPSRAKHSESDPPPRYPSPPPYDQADETPTARTPLLLAHRTHVIRVENTHVRGNESVRRDEEDETNFCGDMGGPGTYYSWLLLRSLAYALFWFGMILGFAMAGRMVWAWGWSGGQEKNVEVVRIGIVGAGPAGISIANTLASQTFPGDNTQLDITIFEQSSDIGGRLAASDHSASSLGHELYAEDVATSCLSQNPLFAFRARAHGISYGLESVGETTTTVFVKGSNTLAKLPRPRSELSWKDWIRLVWRYGRSFDNAEKLPKGTTSRFQAALRRMDSEGEFQKPWDVIAASDISNTISLSATDRLKKNGVNGPYISEILAPQVRRQTGSEIDELSDLAMSLALTREDRGMCGGQAGRYQDVLKKFLTRSQAKVELYTKVTGMKPESINGTMMWILETATTSDETKEKDYAVFDHVVLATPVNHTLLNLPEEAEEVLYRPTYITFFTTSTEPNSKEQILPITPSSYLADSTTQILEFSYLHKLHTLATTSLVTTKYLYKISSDHVLTDNQIHEIAGSIEIDEIVRKQIEMAWPVMMPRSNGDGLGGFEIGNGLWGMAGSEGVVGGVDWSWVVGESLGGAVGRKIGGDGTKMAKRKPERVRGM